MPEEVVMAELVRATSRQLHSQMRQASVWNLMRSHGAAGFTLNGGRQRIQGLISANLHGLSPHSSSAEQWSLFSIS